MSDSDRKQVNRDIQMLRESSGANDEYNEEYESKYDLDDPGALNAKITAKMGIHYPPEDSDRDDEIYQKPMMSK